MSKSVRAKKTLSEFPETSAAEFGSDDFVLLWDTATESTRKCSVGHFTSLDTQSSAASYKGTLDAAADNTVPAGSYQNGDWFFVSTAGTIQGQSVDVNDILKISGSSWEVIPRGVAVTANSRQTVLSSQTAIAGGAGLPEKNPDGAPGWFYENPAGGKINWYLYGDTNYTNNTINSFGGMYAVVNLESGYLYFTMYTKPTGSGDASWYKSRIQWDDDTGQLVQNLAPGRYVLHTAGMDVSAVDKSLPRVEIPQSVAISDGVGAGSEEVWLMALSSSSSFPAGYNKFTVEQFAYKFDEQTHVQDLVAMPELPAVGEPAAASDPGTKFWMSSVANGGALLASGGGYFLYAGPSAANAADVELTMEEAAAAADARVFQTLTGSETVAQLGEMFAPIVAADRKVLDEVQASARGYFHSLDLTPAEIGAKMTLYADALQAAAAGSVEATLGALQSLTIPSAATSGTFDFDPNFQYIVGTTAVAYESYYSGDAAYDAYGIDEIKFSGSFITVYFKDTASMTAWRSQAQTFEIKNAPGTNSWEKELTMDSAAEYSTSAYGYIHYDLTGQLSSSEMQALSMAAADTSTPIPFQIAINAPAVSTATALGEDDVVNQLISALSTHIQKFPR